MSSIDFNGVPDISASFLVQLLHKPEDEGPGHNGVIPPDRRSDVAQRILHLGDVEGNGTHDVTQAVKLSLPSPEVGGMRTAWHEGREYQLMSQPLLLLLEVPNLLAHSCQFPIY